MKKTFFLIIVGFSIGSTLLSVIMSITDSFIMAYLLLGFIAG